MSDIFAEAVAAQLAAEGLGTLNTDIFVNPEVPPGGGVPVDAIFVYTSDGFLPEAYIGNEKDWRRPWVEVRVRRRYDKYGEGAGDMQSIFNALHLRKLTLPADYNFVWCRATTSAATFVGALNKENWLNWTQRFEIGHEYTNR